MWNENNSDENTPLEDIDNTTSEKLDDTHSDIKENDEPISETTDFIIVDVDDLAEEDSAETVSSVINEEAAETDSTNEYTESKTSETASSYEQPKERNIYSSYHISETPRPSYYSEKQAEKKKKKKGGGFIGKALVAGLIFGIAAFGTMFAASKLFPITSNKIENTSPTTTTQTTTPISSSSSTAETDYEIAKVVKEVMPAVVSINCSTTTVYNSFFGQQEYEATSAGTGIIVGSNDTELLIATNNHVVNGAEGIQIAFDDEATASAVLKGSSSDVDLAVVAVKWEDLSEETKAAIKIATLGDSESLIVGEPAIAIGNSLGYGQSVTYGIISALNREVTVTTDDSYGYGNSQEITSELIQTDAAINPGNSGGPLLNSKGEVIGINSVKYSSEEVEGMGYAIPISEALPILEDLMSRETKVKVDEDKASYLGITGTNVTSDAAMIYGMPAGVFVAQLIDDGPAASGGMKRGDIISEMDGTNISSMDDLTEELLYHEAGSTVEVVVNRSKDGEYEEITLEITLGSKADAPTEEELNEESSSFRD